MTNLEETECCTVVSSSLSWYFAFEKRQDTLADFGFGAKKGEEQDISPPHEKKKFVSGLSGAVEESEKKGGEKRYFHFFCGGIACAPPGRR